MPMDMCTHAYGYVHMHMGTHTQTHTYTCTHMNMFIPIGTYTGRHKHTDTDSHIRTCTLALIHMETHTQTHTSYQWQRFIDTHTYHMRTHTRNLLAKRAHTHTCTNHLCAISIHCVFFLIYKGLTRRITCLRIVHKYCCCCWKVCIHTHTFISLIFVLFLKMLYCERVHPVPLTGTCWAVGIVSYASYFVHTENLFFIKVTIIKYGNICKYEL